MKMDALDPTHTEKPLPDFSEARKLIAVSRGQTTGTDRKPGRNTSRGHRNSHCFVAKPMTGPYLAIKEVYQFGDIDGSVTSLIGANGRVDDWCVSRRVVAPVVRRGH